MAVCILIDLPTVKLNCHQPKSTTSAPSSPPKPAPAAAPVRKPATVAAAKPAPAAGPSKPPPASGKAGPSKSLAVSPSEPVKYRFTPEEAASRASEAIPSRYHTDLADPAWKVRLEAAEEMVKWVGEEGGADVDSEIMMRFIGKTPGWGEKNFQVSLACEMANYLADTCRFLGSCIKSWP